MTRKDYIKFAEMISDHFVPARKAPNPSGINTLNSISQATCDIFTADNPNFDRDRFLQACGVES